LDIAHDTITPTPKLSFTVALPLVLRGKPLCARVLSPQGSPTATLNPRGEDRVEIKLGSVAIYASVIIEDVKP
jgi:hypothetical protein